MGQKCFTAPDGNHGEPVQGRSRCNNFLHFRRLLMKNGEVDSVQIRVCVKPTDRPLLYLDTSRMGLLYDPLIPEGNTSTKFIFSVPKETSSLSAHKKDASPTENSFSFYLQSQVVEDARDQVSSDPIGPTEYSLTFQATNNPSLLVADPSTVDPNHFAVYTDISETQRAYLIPNTENLRNPRRRTITAHIDPSEERFVFEVFFQHPDCGNLTFLTQQTNTARAIV